MNKHCWFHFLRYYFPSLDYCKEHSMHEYFRKRNKIPPTHSFVSGKCGIGKRENLFRGLRCFRRKKMEAFTMLINTACKDHLLIAWDFFKKYFVKLGRCKVFGDFQKTGIIEPIVKVSLKYFLFKIPCQTASKNEENNILIAWGLSMTGHLIKWKIWRATGIVKSI